MIDHPLISNLTGCIEVPGILGRCCAELASPVDREEAFRMGALAVRTLLSGQNGMMAGFKRISDDPYQCEEILIPMEKLILHERMFPKEYIAEDQYDVTDAFLRWCRPLIGADMSELLRLL